MSLNASGGSVYRGKLLIHIAENGHSLELDCDESTLVEAVQRFTESMTGIQLHDQLLLCGDMKLESQEPLGSYKLPSKDQEVFCFNKARLQNNAIPPSPEHVEIHDIPEPSPSSNPEPHPLDTAMDPALKALPSYERQFRFHYHCGNAIYSRTYRRLDMCQRLLREQGVQERAMEIARRNLDHFFRILNQNYMDFLKCYSQQHRVHSDLLASFPRDVEKLRACKLHPGLQTPTRKCLLDLVKEENLRKWMENCSFSHKQFENKVTQFKHVFSKLKHDVEDLFLSKASLPIRDLELMIKEHYRHFEEQKSIMQSLSKDVTTVKKLVDDCLSSQLSSSLRPHDAVSALGPMYEVHDKSHLPKMRACDKSISDLLDFCINKKNEMNLFVHSYMQKIAYIQHAIKDVRLQFNAFSEAIKRQDAVFEGLNVVHNIGRAYRACLSEVVRRRASVKLYMGLAGQLAEKLATKREEEVRRREQFLKEQSMFIPRDMLNAMGLFDTPSQCDVHIAPFDTGLLDVDIGDIDRFAPQSLVGLPFRNEKSQISDVEVNEGYGSRDLLDEGELVEIAGTSKLEVENAKLKADLASAIAAICFLGPEAEYGSLDDSKLDNLLKNAAEKTTDALQQKDEYIKHLESMLKDKQSQCQSYEKRIEELAQQLSDKYMERRKSNDDAQYSSTKVDDCRSEILDQGGEGQHPSSRSSELMDDVSSTSDLVVGPKDGLSLRVPPEKLPEGGDENMTDSSGTGNPHLDSSMMDPQQQLEEKDEDKMVGRGERGGGSDAGPDEGGPGETKVQADLVVELQRALEDSTSKLSETESSLKSALEEIASLGSELDSCRKLLDESQMNCAHLENCLHEARQEAQTHLCAADRRASEYNTLRASAVKMRGLFERLRSCVNSSGGVAGFAEALRSLAQSLASAASDSEEDGMAEFRACIRGLADKVSILSRQRAELFDRLSKAEAANRRLTEDLEERKELVKALYTKHQLEKQANKEKISFSRFEVHEIAAFVLNSLGHYEAISRNCPNYFLSAESVALFTDRLPSRPAYIIGQIVHIERRTIPVVDQADHPESTANRVNLNAGGFGSGSESNPFGLPAGCDYFIVTVAMLPDTASPSS